MKKSIFFIGSIALVLSFTACKKEVIEIVQVEESSTDAEIILKSGSDNDSDTDGLGNVTDPDDEDFDMNKKNTDKTGQ